MKTIKKLLDTDPKNGNTKVAKTGAKLSKLGKVRMAKFFFSMRMLRKPSVGVSTSRIEKKNLAI